MQGAQGAVIAFGIGPALNGGDAGDGNGGGHDVGCFRSGDDSRHLKPARGLCLLYQGTMGQDRVDASVIAHGDAKARFRADIVVPAQAGTQFVPHKPGFRLAPE